MDALTPLWDIVDGAQQIGYLWQTQRYKGHLVTFKTGLNGGFTSDIALDRDSHGAVIVLSNTAAQVDEAAIGCWRRSPLASPIAVAASCRGLEPIRSGCRIDGLAQALYCVARPEHLVQGRCNQNPKVD